MSHENGTKTLRKSYTDSVVRAADLIDSELFRPPYGKITPFQFKYIFKNLKKKVVFWTWLAYDFDSTLTSDEIINKAEKIKGGDILVFHDSIKAQKNLKSSLEEIIKMLENRNLQFKNTF